MAKKKTSKKAPRAPSRADRRLADLRWLDEVLDHVTDRIDDGARAADSFKDPATVSDGLGARWRCREALTLAMARATADDLADPEPFERLCVWLDTREDPFDVYRDLKGTGFAVRKFAEDVGAARRELAKILHATAATVGGALAARKPSDLERAILRVLLDAKGRLTAEEIAPRVERKRRVPTTERAIMEAIRKLRTECGFPELRSDEGYLLSKSERGLAAQLVK
jgi:hypothetical protein